MGRFLKTSTNTAKSYKTAIFVAIGETDDRSPDPRAGIVRFNTTSGNLEYYDGSVYQNIAVQGRVNIVKDSFVGDGSTMAYTLSIVPTNANGILVFVGNVHQNPDVAYTISGSLLTFSSPPPNAHTIVVLHGFDSTSV